MFVDITGKPRLKACLHLHTTLSDGHRTPEEVFTMYEKAGYDLLCVTDHMQASLEGTWGDLTLVPGCEYDLYGTEGLPEVFHILSIGGSGAPALSPEMQRNPNISVFQRVKDLVTAIRANGAAAVIAHPAWSLNTPAQILAAGPFDATEIYNSVSAWGMSDRPDSSLITDMLGCQGCLLPLLATDDAHYYDGDQMRGITMLEKEAVDSLGIAGAIRAGRFYATQGPEIHLERLSDTEFQVRCTPAERIVFLSNAPWCAGRVVTGQGLTQARYTLNSRTREHFLRAEVTDAQGRKAWSNYIKL